MGWRVYIPSVPDTQLSLERGVFTLSFDFELVWGMRDITTDLAALLAFARVTREQVFDPLLARLQSRGVVATWATVGGLFRAGAERSEGRLFPDLTPPRHAWHPAPWLDGVPTGTEADHPEFYARSLVARLRDSGQEIGSHSFSHPVFGDPGCSRQTAESELRRCVAEAAELGITLRSFVFPRNVHGHADLLQKYGFTCWRGLEPTWWRHPRVPGAVSRLAHFGEVLGARRPPTVMPTRDEHGLWNIPSSCSFLPIDGVRRLIPLSRRVARCIRGIEQAAQDRRIFHLYLHPINLASDPARMVAALGEVIDHAARQRDLGRIDVQPMGEVARLAEQAAG